MTVITVFYPSLIARIAVSNPAEGMDVLFSCLLRVALGSELRDGLVNGPEESYCMCVIYEPLNNRPRPGLGCVIPTRISMCDTVLLKHASRAVGGKRNCGQAASDLRFLHQNMHVARGEGLVCDLKRVS